MEKSSVGSLVTFYFFLLGLIILFSLVLLFQGIAGTTSGDNSSMNILFVASGVTGLIFTFLMIRRYQVSIQKMLKSKRITVMTVEECLKCNYKNTRPFREGDFVYGYGGECPRCPKDSESGAGDKMIITAIYLDKGAQEEQS